jgi:hypothetical protein
MKFQETLIYILNISHEHDLSNISNKINKRLEKSIQNKTLGNYCLSFINNSPILLI